MADPTPLRAPRADIEALVKRIKQAVYETGSRISVAEAVGALEVVKYEILTTRIEVDQS